MIKYISICVCLFAAFSFANVSQKRFNMAPTESAVQDKSPENPSTVEIPVQSKSSFFLKSAAWQKLVSVQKDLRNRLTSYLEAMHDGEFKVIGWFLIICLIYGLVHALGPGHGKSVVAGYFLARRGNWLQGVGLGFSITMIHTMSAVVLLFVLYIFARAVVFSTFELSRLAIEKASYLLIIVTGFILIVASIISFVKRKNKKDEMCSAEPTASWKELLGVAFVTGIVPCPAVALIVFFCLLHGLPGMALLGAFAIGLGMAITNISFGLGTILLSRGIDKGVKCTGVFAENINIVVSLCGGLLVSATGILLFLSASGA